MPRIKFGPFIFDPALGELLRDGRPAPINHKGRRLLAALLKTPNETVGKAELIEAAWPGAVVEESNLSVQIAALRKLLGTPDDGGEWIATTPRVGYRFAGAVVREPGRDDSIDAAANRPIIAVLPFGMVSEEPGKGYIADGITDDIIAALTRYRWFRVIVRGSVFALRDTMTDMGEAARVLGARYALQGSVRYSAQRLRIVTKLIDTQNGAHLWAERYDLALSDVFAIQDEIAERVAGAIEPELLRSESHFAIRHTGNMAAWDLVRQGMWHFHKVTSEGHRTARELFRRACSIDNDLPEAHSWLGRVSAGIIAYGWSDDESVDGREGMNAATHAVALDARDPYSHYALAIVSCYAGSAKTAVLAARSAINLNPSFALGHLVLGMAYLFDGEAERGVEPLRRGLKLNPNDPQNVVWNILLAYAELLSGQPNEALESATKALAMRPLFGPTFETLACCAMSLGQLEDARQWARRFRDADGPERRLIAPITANQPAYNQRIGQLLRQAGA